MKLIDKEKVVEEIERIKKEECPTDSYEGRCKMLWFEQFSSFLDTLEVKEVDLNNNIQLTWEDMRELYIIFAEVDTEIEFCKCDIKMYETIGYYQEVLKRFKARKGE